jgi:hypothetical protein
MNKPIWLDEEDPHRALCPACGSDNLAHYVLHWAYPVPKGTEGFIGCRSCLAWWDVIATWEAVAIFEPHAWQVTSWGQGTFANRQQKDATRKA